VPPDRPDRTDRLDRTDRAGGADRLDRRQLNRATLARQLLLERVPLPSLDALEHLVGLQAQAPLAAYVGLWSRLDPYDPAELAAATATGAAVRTHAMRATVHHFTARDALAIRALTQPMLRTRFGSSPFAKRLVGVDLDALCGLARDLVTAAPLSRPELGRRLAERFPDRDETALAYAVVYLEPMAQVPPRGVWSGKGGVRWQTYRGWLGADADPGDATLEGLVTRYLAAFGPASPADIRTWSGLAGLGEVVDRLRPGLRAFLDADGREVLDLPDAPRPDPDVPAPVRYLPEYDNVLLSHAERARVIPDRRPVPLPPGDGARAGTVLVDGDFRATWQLARAGEAATLTVRARPPLTRPERSQVIAEGHRLLAFLAPAAEPPRVNVEHD
jgi:DNA glycosylase AlkZ-like